MNPLRITAHLQTPVVSDATLPLDGVVWALLHRDAYGAQDVTYSGMSAATLPREAMPLAIHHAATSQWYYAMSFAQWSNPTTEQTDYWNKRFDQRYSDLVDFGSQRATVIIEKGAYKAYHMPVFTRHACTVTWYGVGDGAALERLLAHATHIGKKTSQGYGAVLRWEVDPWPADWSVYNGEGRLMRALPSDVGVLTGYRPSYWVRSNQTVCTMPTYEE